MKCNCTMVQHALGDGCIVCNTSGAIDLLPQPKELEGELQTIFSDDQIYTIVNDIYKPLVCLISALDERIKTLEG